MSRIGQFNENLVFAGWKADDDQRLAARIDEVPRKIVDGNMDVPDAGRDLQRALPENRDDADVFPRY